LSTRERQLRCLWKVTAGLLNAGHSIPTEYSYDSPPDQDEATILDRNDVTK
jgi:hypothetical protein